MLLENYNDFFNSIKVRVIMIGSSIQSPHIYYGGTKGFSADKV